MATLTQIVVNGVTYDIQDIFSGFVTASVNNLVNYYLKSDTYTKTEVNNLIAAIRQFHYEVYASTSAVTNPASNVLYLIGPTGSGADKYDEYVYDPTKPVAERWIKIGDTSVDLSGYVTTTALNTALAAYTTTANLTTLLAAKQDTISDLSTIRSGAAAGATAYQKPGTGIPKTDLASAVQTSLGKADTAYQKPSGGIPASDIASGVIPTVPTISTDISADAASDVKTSSPKSVKTYVDASIAAVESDLSELADEVEAIDIGEYVMAWDGNSEPVVANIPVGVSVTYNSTTYTGTLAASASTIQKIYLVATGTTDNYDRYITVGDSTYSWVNLGTTEITLADYATKTEVSQLSQEVEAKVDEKIDRELADNALYITDASRNIIAQIDAEGVSTIDVKVKIDGELVSVKSLLSTLSGDVATEQARAEAEEAKKLDHTLADNKFLITDADGNIIVKVDKDGIHSAMSKHAVACMVFGEYYYPTSAPTRDENGNVTHAEVMFGTGVAGSVDITYSGVNAVQVIAHYGDYTYTVTIQRDENGNVEVVSVN